MSDQLLVFIPANPEAEPVPGPLLRSALRACGFIGKPITVFGAPHELPGARFTDLLAFTPPPRPGHLHAPHTIEIVPPTESIEFLGGADTETPACPSCAATLEEWPDILSSWYEARGSYFFPCPSCGARSRPWQLNWHGSCGFGKQQVNVWHVGYHQAVPSQDLLDAFASLGSGPWEYFSFRV